MVPEDPDRTLVRDLASEDAATRRRALGDLFDRHQTRVYNIAYRVLGSSTDAQDIAQEVFLQIADRIKGFRGDSSLTSWVYRMTVNLAIDARRRKARRAAVGLGGAAGADGEPLDPSEARPGVAGTPVDPEAAALGLEREEQVRRALDRLSPKLKAVVVLRYFENLSYEEVADVLEASIGTVKSRLNRAHAALERILGPKAL
jgi:RNA polymerase sigma-70 factor (ECF subfamily)